MPSFLSVFSPDQISLVSSRAEYFEKQAQSITGEIVAGDDIGEVYLDDVSAQFASNGVQTDDVVHITAGAASPLGYYSVAGLFYDPGEDAESAEPFENRLIINGSPTAGGPVTYRVLSLNPILLEISTITESKSRLLNVVNPEVQKLDDVFTLFHDQFNYVCDLVANEHRWLNGKDRTRVDATLINSSAEATTPTALFPELYTELNPNRAPSYPDFKAIDPFDIVVTDSEREGIDDEEAVGLGPTDPLGPPGSDYNNALDKGEAALNAQRAALLSLQAEVALNDSVAEAGNLYTYYVALSTSISQALVDTQNRLNDIAAIRAANRARPFVGGLTNGTYAAARSAIDTRASELALSPYTEFLNMRYVYLDMLVNRAYGTRTELASNAQSISLEDVRAGSLLADLNIERALMVMP